MRIVVLMCSTSRCPLCARWPPHALARTRSTDTVGRNVEWFVSIEHFEVSVYWYAVSLVCG